MAENERGTVSADDDIGHGEGLAGARNAEERLRGTSVADTLHELSNGLGLVAGGLILRL